MISRRGSVFLLYGNPFVQINAVASYVRLPLIPELDQRPVNKRIVGEALHVVIGTYLQCIQWISPDLFHFIGALKLS